MSTCTGPSIYHNQVSSKTRLEVYEMKGNKKEEQAKIKCNETKGEEIPFLL
jgi:hypothetical protein